MWRGKLSPAIREIRLHVCKESPLSEGARNHFLNNYEILQSLNPNLDILLRDAVGTDAKLFARYCWGKEHMIPLNGLTEAEVDQAWKDIYEYADQIPPSNEIYE